MPWYIRLLVFIAEVTYPIFTVPILSDCIFNEQERRGEMKLHLSIANRSGQHLEASSAPLDWCHCLHSLKSWCDVRRQFWLGSILQLQGIGFFIATHMQGIQPLLKWLLTAFGSVSSSLCVGIPAAWTERPLTSQKQGVLPFSDLQGTLPSCSCARAFRSLFYCMSHSADLPLPALQGQISPESGFHLSINSEHESYQRVYGEGEGMSYIDPGKGEPTPLSAWRAVILLSLWHRVHWGSLDFHHNRITLLGMCLPFGYIIFLRQILHWSSL